MGVMESKQVLVMKQFEKGLRTGKYVAQGAHASVGSLLSIGHVDGDNFVIPLLDPFVKAWVTGRFKKIVLYVKSDEELIEIYEQACEIGLPAALIKDAGLTEFNGVATITAVGIGPAEPELIDKITGHLKPF